MLTLKLVLGIAIASGLQSNNYKLREVCHQIVQEKAGEYFLAIKAIKILKSDVELHSRTDQILNKYAIIDKDKCASIYDVLGFIRFLKYQQILSPIINPLSNVWSEFQRQYNYDTQQFYYFLIHDCGVPRKYVIIYNYLKKNYQVEAYGFGRFGARPSGVETIQ